MMFKFTRRDFLKATAGAVPVTYPRTARPVENAPDATHVRSESPGPPSDQLRLTEGEASVALNDSFGSKIATLDNVTGARDAGPRKLAASDGSNFVGFLQSGTNAVARTVQSKLRDRISVKDFGAVGNGAADDTLAFSNAIAAIAARGGGTLFVPLGTYAISSTLDFSKCTNFELLGEGFSHNLPNQGTQVVGNFANDLIRYAPASPAYSFRMQGLMLNNSSMSATATTLRIENIVVAAIEHCYIISSGGYGIFAKHNIFTLNIHDCGFFGNRTVNHGIIGIYTGSHTVIHGCDIVNWGEGVRMSGSCVSVKGCRIEVNTIGLNLGVHYDGSSFLQQASTLSALSFEANDTAIRLNFVNSLVIDGIAILGSTNAPSGQSRVGVKLLHGTCCKFTAWNIHGTFSDAAISFNGGSGNSFTMEGVSAVNGFPGAPAWDVMSGGLGNAASISLVETNYTARPDDTVMGGTWRRHGMCQYLSFTNFMEPNVEGKNLRGKNIPVSGGATTKTIVFTSDHGAGAAAINGATAGIAKDARLPAGIYYYLATIVTAHGECAGKAEKAVAVSGTNNSVTCTFFANRQDGFKRRIYRGTISGIYDGYFETSQDSNAKFVDSGQGFDGFKSPPTAGENDTSMTEPDSNYAVFVAPSWVTNWSVTSKATGGFTINFGTAAPDSGQTIDWLIVR